MTERRQWGAAILGDPANLDHWISALAPPFDPWIEVRGEEIILRSASLENLSTASEVRDWCVACIERLNGAMALDRGSKPVRIGSVVEFGRNGELHRTIFPPLVDVGISFYPPTVTVTTMGPDGKLILRFGGVKNRKREEVFKSLGWAQPKEIDRLKQTANAARHARKKFEPPPNPMAMEDAHALLGTLLRRALSEVAVKNKVESDADNKRG